MLRTEFDQKDSTATGSGRARTCGGRVWRICGEASLILEFSSFNPNGTTMEIQYQYTYWAFQYQTGWWFGTMEFYDFPYIGNVIIPTDEVIFFRGVGIPPNSQISMIHSQDDPFERQLIPWNITVIYSDTREWR